MKSYGQLSVSAQEPYFNHYNHSTTGLILFESAAVKVINSVLVLLAHTAVSQETRLITANCFSRRMPRNTHYVFVSFYIGFLLRDFSLLVIVRRVGMGPKRSFIAQ